MKILELVQKTRCKTKVPYMYNTGITNAKQMYITHSCDGSSSTLIGFFTRFPFGLGSVVATVSEMPARLRFGVDFGNKSANNVSSSVVGIFLSFFFFDLPSCGMFFDIVNT